MEKCLKNKVFLYSQIQKSPPFWWGNGREIGGIIIMVKKHSSSPTKTQDISLLFFKTLPPDTFSHQGLFA
ncbi:hypothetical protein VINI7043_13476 [Vibrio nigripulchritudo ATCC 27043]|nr:hypothetical protein VINI7043_13476 [Vibrio nigripulchritudo ATCC 27043]